MRLVASGFSVRQEARSLQLIANQNCQETEDNMSHVLTIRSIRQEEIKKGLQFIQSSLPYLGTQEDYEIFLKKLVIDLYNEGNDLYRENCAKDSLSQYTEALSIAEYASSDEICIPSKTWERLYVNRAACYLEMGLYEEALKDCEDVLKLNDSNLRALYRKSQALFMLERYKEAYDAVAKCSLSAPQDESVVKLAQDIAVKLGLKIRKAYIRAKTGLNVALEEDARKNVDSLAEHIEPDLPAFNSENPHLTFSSLSVATNSFSGTPSSSASCISPSVFPIAEVGTFPSAIASNGVSSPFSITCMNYGDGDILGDELDKFLDSVPGSNEINKASSAAVGLLPSSKQSISGSPVQNIPVFSGFLSDQYSPSIISPFESMVLNSAPVTDYQDPSVLGQINGTSKTSISDTSSFTGKDSTYLFRSDSPDILGSNLTLSLPDSLVNGAQSISYHTPLKGINPLEDTHEFRQACQFCFTKSGTSQAFIFNSALNHKCKKDILLGRTKSSGDASWKKIRPRPKNQYLGPFYLCKDVLQGNECTYPNCTFAYSQEEIDVWTQERMGTFCREALFGGKGKISLTIPHLLQEHPGTFVFLCGKCFDHKPRIISKGNMDSPFFCSHPGFKHAFQDVKCLVHINLGVTVKYSKIRPFEPNYVLDLCRHEVRYGCLREDTCFYAHSLVELRVWVIQKETGISLDAIVQESRKSSTVESFAPRSQVLNIPSNAGYPNAKIKFVCGQCWRNGQVIEADKNKKYCSAKARHQWSKDHRIVLVMSNERKKWIAIRPYPAKKPAPLQFEMCNHIASGKKCQYIGNCSFAHSPEEKEIWTSMKELGIQDMEQLYEKLMKKDTVEKADGALAQVNKQIHLPTDYAETTVDFHCWLCGKNCNSERQWKMHISSDKHKEKVFHCEEDQNIWQHRFPTGKFSVCKRFLSGKCPDGEDCSFAHGNAELAEWRERRQVLCQKLIKARKDKLISPDDNDFGKYSFLINDLN
ncbi:zinc finger CCCH domain-containing protein 7A [Xenopus tropicalis]|uniref:Zinc finger CCCH domain-containing protein 7A n=1 Tax=Xenopus tropicalis TaxID=8364 RepID=Q28BU3_XENTR|nr:zinc finger CCCH domain-containing protein 7A [Xenopus tropicalis]CAJ82711.1 zinc finger CCCH-type containing 7A [Xenopus tropicalis]|eukprot:NP_001039162.1 zinc finger CCCH domain-containing protein 7A [Xenopus tropicalis]